MNAIKKVRHHIESHPASESSRTLARLAEALAQESEFPLAQLYALNLESFDLAIELMRDWRLDRYYNARLKLFDLASNEVLKT